MHKPTKSTFGDRACLNFLFLNKGYIKGSYTCILFEPTNNQLLNKILMNSHCSDIIQALPHSPLQCFVATTTEIYFCIYWFFYPQLAFGPYPGGTYYPTYTPFVGGTYPVANTPYAGGTYPPPKVVSVPQLKEVRHIRSLFPETWLWRNTTVG